MQQKEETVVLRREKWVDIQIAFYRTNLLGFVGVHTPACEDQLFGARKTHQPRQPLRAPCPWNYAQPGLGKGKLRPMA